MKLNEKLVRNGWSGSRGTYVSVIPDLRSRNILEGIMNCIDSSYDLNVGDLHCTLMYSQFDSPEGYVAPSQQKFKAKMKHIQLLGPNNALVVMLESDELQSEFNRLKELGCVPSYPEYLPHVTLMDKNGDQIDSENYDLLESHIQGHELNFEQYSWDDLVEGD